MGKSNKLNSVNKTPLVTVYITNHNYGKYINKAVQSVLNQSLKNFELIIIDDGSKDNSKKIIERYNENKKITSIFQKNKGLIVSNNLALRLAKGKYILRLDADDWLDPHALEIMSNILERNPKIGLVFPDYHEVDRGGKILRSIRRHNFKKVKLLDQPAHGACTLVRKENLIDIGGYDEEFNCQDGYYLWIRFIKKYSIRNVNLPLFYYRQHGDSLSTNTKRILDNRSKIIKKILNKESKKKIRVLAIIPIRGLKINRYSLVLRKLKKKPLVFYTIENLLKCNNISRIAITTPDDQIIKILRKKYRRKLILIKRPENLAGINTETESTFKHALKNKNIKILKFDCILDMSFNTPFLTSKTIESAINTMQIFNADKVIPVVEETHRYFRHDGSGLKSIIKNSNLKLERDVIYKQINGFNLIKKTKFFKKEDQLKISHIVLNKPESLELRSEDDFKLIKF